MILHFTNPLDNDTLWLPCNLPLGVYLAMWAVMLMVTSLPVKNNTSICPLTLWMAEENVPSQSDTKTEKLTSCDMQTNRKTNIKKQLNGTKHNVLPLPNKSWLGYGPCRITVSHYQAAAQQLTAYNRAEASLWFPYVKTWTMKRDTWGPWNHRLRQYRKKILMVIWYGHIQYVIMEFTRAMWQNWSLIWWVIWYVKSICCTH